MSLFVLVMASIYNAIMKSNAHTVRTDMMIFKSDQHPCMSVVMLKTTLYTQKSNAPLFGTTQPTQSRHETVGLPALS